MFKSVDEVDTDKWEVVDLKTNTKADSNGTYPIDIIFN